MAERHFGPIHTVVNLRTIIYKEGGLRTNYSEIGYLAQVLIYEIGKIEEDSRNGISPKETQLQDLLTLHRSVMKLKEMKDSEERHKLKILKKPNSYYLSIQKRGKTLRL